MSKQFETIIIDYFTEKKRYFFHEDHCLYTCYKSRREILYLRCFEKGCRVRASIRADLFIKSKSLRTHNHKDHSIIAERDKAFQKMKYQVWSSRLPIKKIYHDVLREVSREVAALLSWHSSRRTLQRVRYSQLPSCKSLAELQSYLEDEESTPFVKFGRFRDTDFYHGSIGSHLIFANMLLITDLPGDIDIFVDGTFNVTPFHQKQLLVILATLHNKPRPIIYVVMNSKKSKEYEKVFTFIRDVVIPFDGSHKKVVSSTCDFESSLHKALRSVWSEIVIIGCNFHFTQAIRRYARSIFLLSIHLHAGTAHSKALLMFMRLSLLPLDRVIVGFEAVLNHIRKENIYEQFEEFIEYFKSTWLIRYPPELWCVSERRYRTNNSLEGYNNKIKHTIPLNPSPWAFLDGLLDLAYDATAQYDSDMAKKSFVPKDKSKITSVLTKALAKLKFGVIDELKFLQIVAK